MNDCQRSHGFSLVEMIVVIVITGIIATMVGVFIRSPMEGYLDSVRRAGLTEEADAALRMLGRDLQSALPNSVTCAGGGTLSFLTVRSGGRYREYPTGANTGTPLQFGSATATFDTIGGTATSTTLDARGNAAAGSVVVGNLGSGVANCNVLAAAPRNMSALSATPGATVSYVSNTYFPECQLQTATAAENDREFGRFYVVNPTAVAYACAGGLTRGGVLLANHATACTFACDTSANARVQTISARLTLTSNGESVVMLRQFRVLNLP